MYAEITQKSFIVLPTPTERKAKRLKSQRYACVPNKMIITKSMLNQGDISLFQLIHDFESASFFITSFHTKVYCFLVYH